MVVRVFGASGNRSVGVTPLPSTDINPVGHRAVLRDLVAGLFRYIRVGEDLVLECSVHGRYTVKGSLARRTEGTASFRHGQGEHPLWRRRQKLPTLATSWLLPFGLQLCRG